MYSEISKAEIQVTAFHLKNGYKIGEPLEFEYNRSDPYINWLLKLCCKVIRWLCKFIGERATKEMIGPRKDCRLYRTWLMMEELSETIEGLFTGNEIKYADGLGDLMYVVVGSAITNDIPLQMVFDEVQIANMNKKKRTKKDPRMRNKGVNWQKPNIAKGIVNGRFLRAWLMEKAKEELNAYN